jgi:hypothetical protein
MLKNLLVHIPSERPARPVVDGAVSLAMARAAHLDAVSIGYETVSVGLAVDGGAAVAAVFEVERERALARAETALGVFETEARNAGISYSLKALAEIPAEAAETIGAMARLYDLTIVLQPESQASTFDNAVPQEILFQSGGPVLFIPYTHKGPYDPKRVGIAWDGSRVAARAVRDAAPFLARAQAVTIICLNEELPNPEAILSGIGGAAGAAWGYRADRAHECRPRLDPAGDPVDRSRCRSRSDCHGRLRSFPPARAHFGRRHARHASIHDRPDTDVALIAALNAASRAKKRARALRHRAYAVL